MDGRKGKFFFLSGVQTRADARASWFPLGAKCLSFRSVKSIGLLRCRIPGGKIKSDPNPNPHSLVGNAILTWRISKI